MRILIVVDMQNDFIDGSLGSAEAVQIVPYVCKKIEEYKAANQTVVFTRDTHTVEYLSTQEGKNLPVEHCILNTPGWKIRKELGAQDSLIFNKPAFGSVELAEYMRKYHHEDEFELVGLCTDICVISNAMLLKSYLPENKIIVDAKGCAGVTPESHRNALNAMKMCQIHVINE